MTGRIDPEHLAIHGMRDPSQRMPVAVIEGLDGPGERTPAQAVLHVQVFGDVTLVVDVGEGMMDDREIQSDGRNQQHHAEPNRLPVSHGVPRIRRSEIFEGRRSYRSHRCAL